MFVEIDVSLHSPIDNWSICNCLVGGILVEGGIDFEGDSPLVAAERTLVAVEGTLVAAAVKNGTY
jgi:hypothetical protein